MLKRIALLVAMAALTIVKPSNAVAQGWDGCCGITVNVGFPFQHRDFCCERRFSPDGSIAARSAGFSPDGSSRSAGTFAARRAGFDRSGVRPMITGIGSHRMVTTGMGVIPMPVMATMNTERY